MNDIEKKALALVNEEPGFNCCHLGEVGSQLAIKALCRAIEQHEAFRRKVSDAVEAYHSPENYLGKFNDTLGRFILPKPVDPDVQIVRDILHAHQRAMTPPDSGWGNMSYSKGSYDHLPTFKAALTAYKEKHGCQIEDGE